MGNYYDGKLDEMYVPAYQRFAEMDAMLSVARLPSPSEGLAQAVVRVMRVIAARYVPAHPPAGYTAAHYRAVIDPDVASGRRVLTGREITVAELLGPGYDIAEDRVQLFHYGRSGRSGHIFEGLAHALLDPPYGLRRPKSDWGKFCSPTWAQEEPRWMRDVLRSFCNEVLDLPDPRDGSRLRIRTWPTDWSTYFEAGREWWGEFLWTVEHLENDTVTVIAASTTD